MREIKFRAWDKIEKRMRQVNMMGVSGKSYDALYFLEGNHLNIENAELLQFTGLKDKNGKEIYEGDIIKGRNLEGFYKIKEVKWDVNQWYPFAGHRGYEDFEIIGDIYENKELIK